MRSGRAPLAGLVVLVLLGCGGGDECPRGRLELRPFEGAPVTVTAWSCSGEIQSSAVCRPNATSGPFAGREFRSCPGVPLLLGQDNNFARLDAVVLYQYFDSDGTLSGVAAQKEFACDNDCSIDGTPPLAGWIMPEVASPVEGMRNAGRFHLEFPRGVIEGTYDSAHPGPPALDAGL